MTDKEKLLKLKKLADAMYYAAQQLTTDASRLHKAMDEYHQFLIYEYYKEEPTIPDIVDEHYWEMLGEEPVSEDLEKIVEEIAEPTILKAYGTKELARRLRNTICGTSVSEDLGEYINELSKQFPEVSFAKLSRIAVRVAKWQKEQMIKDATDVTVHIDAGGYPYIPQMELYDYDRDIPLAKKGDKYKVLLIKEE